VINDNDLSQEQKVLSSAPGEVGSVKAVIAVRDRIFFGDARF